MNVRTWLGLLLLTWILGVSLGCDDTEKTSRIATGACPNCGARQFIPIDYGKPGPEAMESARRGEIIHRGCVMDKHSPTRHCKKCDTEW